MSERKEKESFWMGFFLGVCLGVVAAILIRGLWVSAYTDGINAAYATATWGAEQFHIQLTAIATMTP